MAGIKITDLPSAPSAQLTDVFPVDQLPGPVTYKESNSQLLSLFKSNGEALTRTNDTNVTMTLGGSPATALFNATSMTLGWAGQLSVPRGGTGNSTFTAYSVICAGTTATGAFQNVVGVGNSGEQLTSNGPGTLPTWQPSSSVTPAALTKVDDTNVTLTLGGTPATALLQATSITAGWTGTLSGTRGGTGVNNGANTATFAGNLNFSSSFITSGAFSVTQTYTGITNVTFPTTGTLATISQIPTGAALTKGDDTNVTLTLGGSPTTSLVNAASITAGWTGQLSETRGGTAQSTYALGDTLYSSAANTLSKLAGNTTAVKQYLSQTGTGVVSAAPSWATISGGDITGAALTKTDDTNVTLTLGGTPATALLRAASLTLGWTGQLSVARGGTGLSSVTAHDLMIGNGTSALTLLAPSATSGIPLVSQGASADPAYSTAVVAGGGTGITSATAYAVLCGGTTSTNPFQSVASVGTSGQVLTSNGAGALPTMQTASSGVINIQQAVKTDTQTISTTTLTDLSGLSIAITPSASTSKVLVICTITMGQVATQAADFLLLRDSTPIFVGDAAGSRAQVSTGGGNGSSATAEAVVISFLDSPATTSAVTYKIQGRGRSVTSFYINRTDTDTNGSTFSRYASSIVVMEVKQ